MNIMDMNMNMNMNMSMSMNTNSSPGRKVGIGSSSDTLPTTHRVDPFINANMKINMNMNMNTETDMNTQVQITNDNSSHCHSETSANENANDNENENTNDNENTNENASIGMSTSTSTSTISSIDGTTTTSTITKTSNESNTLSKLLESADAPLSSHQKALRRSTRRRTLAPVFRDPHICTDTRGLGLGFDEELLDYKRNRLEENNKDDSIHVDSGDFDDDDVDNQHHDDYSNPSTSKKAKLSDDGNIKETEMEMKMEMEKEKEKDVQDQNEMYGTCTPPRQKRPRRSQRRRSLAIQNGSLLLRPNTTNSDSDSGAGIENAADSTLTVKTMSSLSDMTNSALSVWTPGCSDDGEKAIEDVNEGRIEIVSASDTNTNMKTISAVSANKNDPQPLSGIDTSANNNNVNNSENDSYGRDQNRIEMESQSTAENKSISSTLSSLCNGVAALMDRDINVMTESKSETLTAPTNNASKKKKKPHTKRKKSKKKATVPPTTPRRRSARIRRSMMVQKTEAESKRESQSEPSAKVQSNDDKSGVDNNLDDAVIGVRMDAEPKPESAQTKIAAKFKLSTFSPCPMERDKIHEEYSGDAMVSSEEAIRSTSASNEGANAQLQPQDADGKNGDESMNHQDISLNLEGSSNIAPNHEVGQSASSNEGQNDEIISPLRYDQPCALPSKSEEVQIRPLAECNTMKQIPIIKEKEGSLNPPLKIHMDDELDDELDDAVEKNPTKGGTTKTISVTGRPQNNKTGSKTKRRRRSSLGLHAGGMISLKDIEAIEKETSARRRRRSVSALPKIIPVPEAPPQFKSSELYSHQLDSKNIQDTSSGSRNNDAPSLNIEKGMDIDTNIASEVNIDASAPKLIKSFLEPEFVHNKDKSDETIESVNVRMDSDPDHVPIEKINELEKHIDIISTTHNESKTLVLDTLKESQDITSGEFSPCSIIGNKSVPQDEALGSVDVRMDYDPDHVPIGKISEPEQNIDIKPATHNESKSVVPNEVQESQNITSGEISPSSIIVNKSVPQDEALGSVDVRMDSALDHVPTGKCSEPEQNVDTKPAAQSESRSVIPNEVKKSRDITSGEISPCSIIGDKSVPHQYSQFQVSAKDIKLNMHEIFEDSDIYEKPCMTARLFSCAILRLKCRGYDMMELRPLISLLRAYVDAELASLQDLDIRNDVRKKKLHFCSFDLSSTINPIDTILESNNIIETCIAKLHNILKHVDGLTSSGTVNDQVIHKLEAFIATLIEFEKEPNQYAFAQCAEAMPFIWPKARFTKASKQYHHELTILVNRMNNSKTLAPTSFVRRSLGDFIGRAIRFHLRRYFNPVPLPLHSDGDDLPDYSSSRSRIHEIVEMRDDDDEGRDTATADGSISSVIGIALQRIIEMNQLNEELLEKEHTQSDSRFVNSFCNRPASVRGLQERGCVIQLSNHDIQDILLDMQVSHTFLAGIRARRFIHELFTWPGVSEAILEAGGWIKIEFLANIFQECQLTSDVPAEGHFVLLSNVNALLSQISEEEEILLDIEQKCEDTLRRLWKRFRCGTRNKDLLKMNPCIKTFQKVLKTGGMGTKFPFIVEAEEWE